MKKITQLLIFLLPVIGFSQEAKQKIQTYLNANYGKMGLTASDVNGWFIESEGSSESTKINTYFIKQRVNGIEVFNAISNVWVKNGEVINVADQFVPNAGQKINASTPSLSVLNALSGALAKLQVINPGTFEIIGTLDTNNFKISNGILTEDPVTAELVYQLTAENTLKLAWDFTFYTPDFKHLWSVRIDAVNGNILDKHDMVISCTFGEKNHFGHKHGFEMTNSLFKSSQSVVDIQSGSYRVIPFYHQAPTYGARELIVTPHNATASPWGWHDTNNAAGAEFTITRGNNVQAQEDRDANNGTGISPNGGAGLVFDFPYDGITAQSASYTAAATTNLFYMNNIMHDVWYQYGFNEINGNFQQNNYGKGGTSGITGDAVFADSQDGSGVDPNINNANFATPVDGQRPRMQMFLWNVAPPIRPLTILSPLDIAGEVEARDNVFDPGHVNIPIAPAVIESDLVLFNDGTPDLGQTDNADACAAAVNAAAINGHITVIRRSLAEAAGGTPCAFIEKVKFAQNAGATAVIIVNNVPPSDTVPALINMSGADATIIIPAINISQANGEALIARMKVETVHAKLQLGTSPFVNADGDFDNGIIAHEYGHGISTRLTGGAGNSSCLQHAEQAGEGWSDWFALMMQLKQGDNGGTGIGIGTFAVSQATAGSGIRNFLYSNDMSVNPLTFADSNDEESHNRGEFMAAVLWDLTWAYIGKYGHNPNVYSGTGGNNKVMRLVIDALKLQPCSPTFIEFRTALIAADQATTGGADYCTIWSVFARRGMGALASSGSRTNSLDQVQDFSLPTGTPNCALGIDYFENDAISVYPNPSNGMVTIHIGQFTRKASIQVIDMNGREVYNDKDGDFNIEKTINLNHLQSGMYVLKVNGESLNYTKKIILN